MDIQRKGHPLFTGGPCGKVKSGKVKRIAMSNVSVLIVWSIAASVAAGSIAPAALASPGKAAQMPAQELARRLIAEHNKERAGLGIAPLAWSDALAIHARKWARALAMRNALEHADSADRPGQGENVWSGTTGAYTPEEMIGSFLEERIFFKRGLFPRVSTTGDWHDVGHYTQMIWQDTKEVGCAIERNAQDDFLVCRYAGAGNVMGEVVYSDPAPITLPARLTRESPRNEF
jgi:hypothetical protein